MEKKRPKTMKYGEKEKIQILKIYEANEFRMSDTVRKLNEEGIRISHNSIRKFSKELGPKVFGKNTIEMATAEVMEKMEDSLTNILPKVLEIRKLALDQLLEITPTVKNPITLVGIFNCMNAYAEKGSIGEDDDKNIIQTINQYYIDNGKKEN